MLIQLVECPHWDAGRCAIGKAGGRPSAGRCHRCRPGCLTNRYVDVPDVKPEPVPPEKWPTWASAIALMAREGDAGVGSTFERLAADTGLGAAYKAILAMARKSCGCAARRDRWNAEYPYQP